jgi:hypothetical protein
MSYFRESVTKLPPKLNFLRSVTLNLQKNYIDSKGTQPPRHCFPPPRAQFSSAHHNYSFGRQILSVLRATTKQPVERVPMPRRQEHSRSFNGRQEPYHLIKPD